MATLMHLELLTLMFYVIFTVGLGRNDISSHTCYIYSNELSPTADCSAKQLTSVPRDLPQITTILNLSLNQFTHIGPRAFSSLPKLEHLNLTNSGIWQLDDGAFNGLENLKELFLGNNPVLGSGPLSDKLFLGCPNIQRLSLRGSVNALDVRAIKNLKHLEHLTITSRFDALPQNITSLKNLKNLEFAFGIFPNLTRDLMQPFSKMNLEVLSFHRCRIRHIENGTFTGFSKLKLLNLACNEVLSVTNVLDAISSSDGLELNKLVLDFVNHDKPGWYLGPGDIPVCRKVWRNLTHLAMRAVRLTFIHPDMLICMKNLQSVAIGLNTLWTTEVSNLGPKLYNLNWRSFDFAYGFMDDHQIEKYLFAYDESTNWLPESDAYFAPVLPDESVCNEGNVTPVDLPLNNGSIPRVFKYMPHCLTYYNVYHTGILAFQTHDYSYSFRNKLRYMNFSYIGVEATKWKEPIIGLTSLRIADISGFRLSELARNQLSLMPELTTFIGRDNAFTEFYYTPLPRNLEKLDLSNNQISHIGQVFESVYMLKYLLLSGNNIEKIDFITPSLGSLKVLDLSNNKLAHIPQATTTQMDLLWSTKRNFVLDIRNNMFMCSCTQLHFIQWIRETSIQLRGREKLTCLHDNENVNIVDVELGQLESKCYHIKFAKEKIIGAVVGVLVLFMLGTATVYKLRWAIRWKYYKIKYNMRQNRNGILMQDLNLPYTTYIIYSEDDDDISHWVSHTLLHQIEDVWNLGPVYLPGRDDLAGLYDVENITRGLQNSQNALWVLSPKFSVNNTCGIAAHFAFRHFGREGNLILVHDGNFDEYSLALKQIKSLLDSRHGLSKITYSSAEDGLRVFWMKLKNFLLRHCSNEPSPDST